MNNSVMKCCICDNEKIGEFITINDKKYHLCCIEQLQNNWNELKKWLEKRIKYYKEIGYNNTYLALQIALEKMQELGQAKDESN